MSTIIIERKLLVKIDGKLMNESINIYSPYMKYNGKYIADVEFELSENYTRSIDGCDRYTAVKHAIIFIESVCSSSRDPEFFHLDGDSMLHGWDGQ